MTPTTENNYPNVAQSWGIAGIIVGLSLVFTPVLMVLTNPLGKEAATFSYYLCATGLSFLIAHRMRSNETGQKSYPIHKIPAIVLLLSAMGIMALQTGITSPLIELMPHGNFYDMMMNEMLGMNGFWSFFSMVIAAPILEELLMRGIILDGLLKKYSPVKAIVLSSFLFGLIHLNPWQFVGAFFFGAFVGWIYYRTHNLLITILLHAINNGTAFVSGLVMDKETATQPLVEFYGGWLNTILITFVAILVAAASIYFLWNEFKKTPPEDATVALAS